MSIRQYQLQWEVGPAAEAGAAPERFVPAQVPGAVQLDWARANGIPFPENAGNPGDYRWMEDSYWLYRARLEFPEPAEGEQVFFICGGIDYQFEVRVDGHLEHAQEGMFTPVEIDLTGRARPGSLLEVLVFPAPKSHTRVDDRTQADRSAKPAVSYGWDFHPRLVPLGIWQDAGLEIRPQYCLAHAETSYRLSDGLDAADVFLKVRLSQPGEGEVCWRLLDPDGHSVLEARKTARRSSLHIEGRLAQPRLWWPNGQGPADLYTSVVELAGPDGEIIERREARVGFKRVRLVMHPTQWEESAVSQAPVGPNRPPVTFEVNGRRVFAKGSNWVSPDIFPGRITAETYRPLLEMARDAHFNLLRCWGGAIVQKEAFFNLCDELGLMVWQEFPLACNRYAGEAGYLKVLDQESRSIIQRLRPHACLSLWCGGNELFNNWSRMTNQDLALRLLNRNTFDLDPDRPFLETAPQYGMGHGFYTFVRPDGKEVYQYVPESHCTAYDEFAVPGPASADLLRKILPPEELFPPRPSAAWVTRHAYQAWDGSDTSWLELPTLERYFGKLTSLEQLVECGQFLQSEGLKFFFEETRRQKPVCSIGLNWCYNEPWPSAANGSLVNWPAEPKPALGAVKAALRPVLASARPQKLRWQPGETFQADLFLLNDLPEAIEAGCMVVFLQADGPEQKLMEWDFTAAEANQNLTGPAVRYSIPEIKSARFQLVLRVAGHPEWESTYTLLVGK
jgi:beta-mannosidase